MTDNPRLISRAVVALRAFCAEKGWSYRDLARHYRTQADPSRGVHPPKQPPFAGAKGWLEGRATPNYDGRRCIADLTKQAVKIEDWETPAEGPAP